MGGTPKKAAPAAARPMAPAAEESVLPDRLKAFVREASSNYVRSSRRMAKDTLYSTLEDFTRADSKKRLVVIGCTGSGKSTLLNVCAGWKFVQSKESDYEFKWQSKGDDATTPLFASKASDESVTKVAAFANVDWCGDAERELIVVDTPGHDDPSGAELDSKESREALGALAADLHNKLKALGSIHAILVLHNDVLSNRLNPATYQVLKMIDEKFVKAGTSVWEHVIVGYSKCNGHETSWRSGLAGKSASLQAAIKVKIPGCEVDVPVVALGGGEIEPAPPSQEELGLDTVWQFVAAAQPLDTSDLQPFEGADVKWQRIVDERDTAEAKAKAAIIYIAVLLKLSMLVSMLFWRHALLPSWLGLLCLNLPGLYDELLLLCGFVYWVGPLDVYYSCGHCYRQWVQPQLERHLPPKVLAALGQASLGLHEAAAMKPKTE